MKAKKERGRCRYCDGRYTLTAGGRVRRHNQKGTKNRCGGSGQVPV